MRVKGGVGLLATSMTGLPAIPTYTIESTTIDDAFLKDIELPEAAPYCLKIDRATQSIQRMAASAMAQVATFKLEVAQQPPGRCGRSQKSTKNAEILGTSMVHMLPPGRKAISAAAVAAVCNPASAAADKLSRILADDFVQLWAMHPNTSYTGPSVRSGTSR